MSAPLNPNRLLARAMGAIRDASLKLKDDAAFGNRVREVMETYSTDRQTWVAEIVRRDTLARERKALKPQASETDHPPPPAS